MIRLATPPLRATVPRVVRPYVTHCRPEITIYIYILGRTSTGAAEREGTIGVAFLSTLTSEFFITTRNLRHRSRRPWNFTALVLCTECTEKLSLHRFKRPIAQSQSGVKEIFEIKRVDEHHFPASPCFRFQIDVDIFLKIFPCTTTRNNQKK